MGGRDGGRDASPGDQTRVAHVRSCNGRAASTGRTVCFPGANGQPAESPATKVEEASGHTTLGASTSG